MNIICRIHASVWFCSICLSADADWKTAALAFHSPANACRLFTLIIITIIFITLWFRDEMLVVFQLLESSAAYQSHFPYSSTAFCYCKSHGTRVEWKFDELCVLETHTDTLTHAFASPNETSYIVFEAKTSAADRWGRRGGEGEEGRRI